MNVLQNLIELYNHLPSDSTYRDVVKGILLYLEETADASIYDLAEMTNSSRTTIWRMLKKLGYENYADFRRALKAAVSKYTYYNRIFPKKAVRSDEAFIAHVSQEMTCAASYLAKDFSAHPLTELAKRISGKKQVYFYFPYRSSAIHSFQQNLWIDGKNSEYQCLLPQMLSATRYLDDKSITLISTIEYAETLDMTRVFETVKQKGSRIWLTGNAESRYADYADRHVLMAKAPPAVWLIAFELFILALSERYRSRFIDKQHYS